MDNPTSNDINEILRYINIESLADNDRAKIGMYCVSHGFADCFLTWVNNSGLKPKTKTNLRARVKSPSWRNASSVGLGTLIFYAKQGGFEPRSLSDSQTGQPLRSPPTLPKSTNPTELVPQSNEPTPELRAAQNLEVLHSIAKKEGMIRQSYDHPYTLSKGNGGPENGAVFEITDLEVLAEIKGVNNQQYIFGRCLIIPITGWSFQAQAYQLIYGDKTFGKFHKRNFGGYSGLFHNLDYSLYYVQDKTSVTVIALSEGYETGRTLRKTYEHVVVCISSNNFAAVVKAIREHPDYGDVEIHILTDNDQNNAGLKAAVKAKHGYSGVKIFMPPRVEYDFNDIQQRDSQVVDSYFIANTQVPEIVINHYVKELRLDIEEGVQQQDNPFSSKYFLNINRFLTKEAPDQNYLVDKFLVEQTTFVLVAQGGTGKSYFMLQLAMCLAAGDNFFDMSIPLNKKVLCVFGEDDPDEIWRRFRAVYKGLTDECRELNEELLEQNLLLISDNGNSLRLLNNDGKGTPSVNTEYLTQTILEEDIDVVLLDPLRKLTTGDENDNFLQHLFFDNVDKIKQRTGVTIGLVHHVSKGAQAAAKANAAAVIPPRGAAAFVDDPRAVFYMMRDTATDIKFGTYKTNYTAHINFEMTMLPVDKGVYLSLKQDAVIDDDHQSILLDFLNENVTNALNALTKEKAKEYLFKNRLHAVLKDTNFLKDIGLNRSELEALIKGLINEGVIIEAVGEYPDVLSAKTKILISTV